jgi:hypothetical protein
MVGDRVNVGDISAVEVVVGELVVIAVNVGSKVPPDLINNFWPL